MSQPYDPADAEAGSTDSVVPARKPGRVWYVVATLLPILGLASGIWLAIAQLSEVAAGLHQVVVPGEAIVLLEEPGTYTIFHEDPTVVDGRYYSTGPVPGLGVEVIDPSGVSLPLAAPRGNFEYSVGGRTGVSVLVFDTSQSGPHQVIGSYIGPSGEETVLAVGSGVGGAVGRALLVGLGLPVLGLLLGIGVGLVTFIRRRRAARAETIAIHN